MYIPGTNRMEQTEEIFRFMQQFSFATIVSSGAGGLIATHVPVEIETDPHGTPCIRTHIARANQQWKQFNDTDQVMVIFMGPHTYISSSWYDHVNVPTWNYLAVHVYGKPRLLNDAAAEVMLQRLVERYEQQEGKRFSMDQMERADIDAHLKALVAFEISIDRIDAKAKLSQNRNKENFDRILTQLDAREDADSKAIHAAMLRIRDSIK